MYSVCGLFEGSYKSVGEPDLILKMENRIRSGGKIELEYLFGFIPKFMGFGQSKWGLLQLMLYWDDLKAVKLKKSSKLTPNLSSLRC